MNVQTLSIDVLTARQPLSNVLTAVQQVCAPDGQAVDWHSVAWVLPRVEQAGLLRAALCATGRPDPAAPLNDQSNPHVRGVDGPAFGLSPVIFSADRLSDHAAWPAWLDLHLTVFKELERWPQLIRHARSLTERWQLAGEYLELAHAWVGAQAFKQAASGSAGMADEVLRWSGLEASIVQALAGTLGEALEHLQAQAPSHPAWSSIRWLVWLDDGEPRVGRWIARHAGQRAVLRVDLLGGEQSSGSTVTLSGHRVRGAADRVLQQWAQQPGAQQSPVLLDEPSAQSAAHAAAATVLGWLSRDPRRPVGVAVVDRLVARRVSGLLASAGVLVDDRTGWRLSTTRVAGWLNCLLNGWLQQDWMTWLCGLETRWVPAWTQALQVGLMPVWSERASRSYHLNTWDDMRADARRVTGQPPVSGGAGSYPAGDGCSGDAHGGAAVDTDIRAQSDRLMTAFSRFGLHPRPFRQWAADVCSLLDDLGCTAVLASDRAGDELLSLLRLLQRTGSAQPCSAREWMLILGTQLEGARFRPQDVRSPVRFMPLQSFRLQRFDQTLVLGVGSRHFMPSPPGLLPPSVADELGLADPWLDHEQALCALAEIVCNSTECVLTHQRESGGSADPLLGALRALGLRIRVHTGRNWAVSVQPQGRCVPRTATSAPALRGLPQPERLPVKAVASLAACPLKFALDGLVRPTDALDPVAAPSDAALRGIWLHNVFERLWRDVLPETSAPGNAAGQDRGSLAHGWAWMQPLRQALQEAWAALPAPARPRLLQERLEFERHLAALADALAQRHAHGWSVVSQERSVSRPLSFSEGHAPVQVHGRMDQLQKRDGLYGIVDIKTGRSEALRRQADQWADHPQLPLYAWMLESACDSLAYLATRGDKPAYVELEGASVEQMGEVVVARLQEALVHLFVQAGTAIALPGRDCKWCEHAGVCRSAWWQGPGEVPTGEEGSDE